MVGIGILVYYMFINGKMSNGSLYFQGKESADEQLKTRFVMNRAAVPGTRRKVIANCWLKSSNSNGFKAWSNCNETNKN